MPKDDALEIDQNQFIYLAIKESSLILIVVFPQSVLALKENTFAEVEISSQ